MNGKKRILSLLLAGAMMALPLFAQAAGGITGSVTSNGSDKVTLALLSQDGTQVLQTASVAGNSGSYTMEDVEDGQYILKASKYNHAPRKYDVTVAGGTLTQDVKLCLQGDVSGDGRINVGDAGKAYSHVRQTALLEDDYALSCADMNQDGKLNVGDVGRIYSQVRNSGNANVIPALPSNPVEDNKDAPVEIGGTLCFEATVKGGHLTYFDLYRVTDTTLTIDHPMAYVIYNGVTYEAVNGTVTVPDLYSDSTNKPISLAIGNRDSKDHTFTVTLSYPQGHQMNPIQLTTATMSNVSTFCEEGNSQGVYYSFTASKAGKLTVKLSEPIVDCNITITSTAVEGGTHSVSLSDNPDSTTLTFEMAAGESVSICIVMNPQNGFNYPEATVKTSMRFR